MIDTHAHLAAKEFSDEDLKGVLERAKQAGITDIINICTDPWTLERGLKLSEKHTWIHAAASTTPHDVGNEGESSFPIMEEAARLGKLVAIGETGLDYHYEHSPKEVQKQFLVRYLRLATSLSLPVIIHCRDAFSDLFSIFDQEYRNKPFVLHCFTGTEEEAKEVTVRGGFLSFSGIVTFKKSEALQQVAKKVPLEHLLIETDAPYLAPQSRRGCRNEPAFLLETAQCLASLFNRPLEEFLSITSQNAKKLFQLI